MPIHLLIKGRPRDARIAAKEYGIPLTAVKERRAFFSSDPKRYETTADAPCSAGVPVRNWFGRHDVIIPGTGYDGGTLLHFTERCEGLGRARLAGACPTGTVFHRKSKQCVVVRGEMLGRARRR